MKRLVQEHLRYTGSEVARAILLNWERERRAFVKVRPPPPGRPFRSRKMHRPLPALGTALTPSVGLCPAPAVACGALIALDTVSTATPAHPGVPP